jgi:hypothetical protein
MLRVATGADRYPQLRPLPYYLTDLTRPSGGRVNVKHPLCCTCRRGLPHGTNHVTTVCRSAARRVVYANQPG